jgi:hypothetical protein
VVVVAVRAQDRRDRPVPHRGSDRRGVVGSVDDEDLVVVADEPDVVLDIEVLAVERENAGRRDVLDHGAVTMRVSHRAAACDLRSTIR